MSLNWFDWVQDRGPQTLLYLAFLLFFLAVLGGLMPRLRDRLLTYINAPVLYAALSVLLARALACDGFDLVRLLAFAIFGGGCLLSCLLAAFSWPRFKVFAVFYSVWGVVLPLIAVDAFILEPHDLQMTHYSVQSKRLTKPLRIAVLTDLQTDHIGEYERQAVRRMLAEKPDLIVFPGDYVQCLDAKSSGTEMMKLRQLLLDEHVSAPLGAFSVQGNTESPQWPSIFEGTAVQAIEKLNLLTTANIDITGMTLDDSFNTHLVVPRKSENFHIALGHAPDFSLGQIDADLLIAGHTHGGQVNIPMVGPLLTFSKVPDSWAAGGLQDLGPEKHLVIAKGVGMERQRAPRLRFLCRPELVIIDVAPAK